MNSAREQPHIAVVQRESLRWVPEPAGEVVDVFSMELGKYFMDLRIYKSGERRGQVDWAMAGVPLTKLRFLNIIDYRGLHSEPLPALAKDFFNPEETDSPLDATTPDDVTIRPLDSNRYLEAGRMPNPDSSDQAYVPFEEVWQRLPVPAGEDAVLLESLGGDRQGKAYLAQVAGWRMGLMDSGKGSFHGWRDQRDGSEWRRIRQTSDQSRDALKAVPEDVITQAEEGKVISWAGRQWIVRVKAQT